VVANAVPPRSLIRSVRSRSVGEWTEISFPLQTAVPVSLQQSNRSVMLTLYNTTAQTDVIRVDRDPLVERIDWQQVDEGRIQYSIRLKPEQQWGYKMRYEGTTLILSLRHPPKRGRDLAGLRILIDPGHGGPEDLGSRGPTGYPEKTVALRVSQLVRDRLQKRGATVVMTRDADLDLFPNDRVKIITDQEPHLALSLHYNALPDNGDALNTSGVSTYWYQTQAYSLAAFIHDYLTRTLDRPSYGIYWDNLALTRPAVCPSVLLELGFMINPQEFEWITDERQQEKLADAIADGVVAWFERVDTIRSD
jgi:N-acetylmuramoyl-L-alanine amidase